MHIVGLDLPDAIVHQPVGYETNRVIRNETNFRYEMWPYSGIENFFRSDE